MSQEILNKLAEDAKLACDCGKGRMFAYWNDGVDLAPYLKKFAELIIAECVGVIDKDCIAQYDHGTIANLGGLNQARNLIKEHFGVK